MKKIVIRNEQGSNRFIVRTEKKEYSSDME